MQIPEMDSDEYSAEEAERLAREAHAERLVNLSLTIKGFRDDAVKGRAASGIEAEWLQDEEYYQGIDEANRAEHLVKPTSPDGRVFIQSSSDGKQAPRSTVFVNLTRPYVDAAAARVSDMLLPTDDRNWDMRPTPIPDLLKALADETPVKDASGQVLTQHKVGQDGQPIMAPTMVAGDQPMLGPDGQPMMSPVSAPVTAKDIAKQAIDKASASCDKAKEQIDDWLVQCRYHAEVRLVIEDSARLGVGILKGPFPENVRRRAVTRALEGIGIIIKEEILPRSRRIDPWNFYPDPSCGELIQNGKYVFERDDITSRQLQDLKAAPGYLADAIEQIIQEGPKSQLTGDSKRQKSDTPNDRELYEIWYYHGYLSSEDLLTAGCQCEQGKQFPAIVTMVNDIVIKAALAPLDAGEFPYDVMIWQRRTGHWAGIGVARQMRTSQDGVNAGTRNMMDNAGLSGGPIIIIDRNRLEPADGNWNLTPRKVFYTKKDAEEIGNIREAIVWINIQALQTELLGIIQFWMQRAEDQTGLPMLLQGQLGKAPDTVGGMTMLNNNATSVLRRIARTFDDRVTEPHIGRYYEWLLLHGDDEEAKGDFTIDARGSSALVERDAQGQALMQLTGMTLNPAFGQDPEKIMAEAMKSMRLDPEKTKMDDDKRAKLSQPAPPYQVQVEQLRQQGRMAGLQAEQSFEAQQAEVDRAFSQWEKTVDSQIEMARLDNARGMNTDNLKVDMANNIRKLRAQIELAMRPWRPSPQVAVPPMEPPGRAAAGFAYQE